MAGCTVDNQKILLHGSESMKLQDSNCLVDKSGSSLNSVPVVLHVMNETEINGD